MNTWKNFSITAVRKNWNGSEIDSVQIRKNDPNFLGDPRVENKSNVISMIERDITFNTATLNSNNQWVCGPEVHVVKGRYGKYLRSDANNIEEDNLGSLPSF